MRIQKLMSALTACCLGATALASMPMQAFAADETLTFDIKCAGANKMTLTADAVAQGDVVLPVSIYVTENPGVFAISLKMQVNDGEVAEDGSFGNYGFTLTDGAFASPYCFDSNGGGDAALALFAAVTSERMNIGWTYSADTTLVADAYAESGTTNWDTTVAWATDYAFVNANLVVPQGTEPGTYVFDIRREKYVLANSPSSNTVYSQSTCKGANGVSLEYTSVPFTVVVEEAEATTTTTTETTPAETTTTTTETTPAETTTTTTETTPTETTTTTTETTPAETTTTTTETTPAETFPAEVLPDGSDAYADLLAGDDYTYIYGNVSGTPGSTVEVPVYVYNDPGTAGMMFYIDYDPALTDATIKQGRAYMIIMTVNPAVNPMAVLWATGDGSNMTATNGGLFLTLSFTIPEDAAVGTVYEVNTADYSADGHPTELSDTNGVALDVKHIGGTITVVESNDEGTMDPTLNYSEYSFTNVGDSLVLELLNAGDGEVTWYTTNPEAVSVVATGNMAVVTATALDDAQIIAVLDGVEYVCDINGGLFGDIDRNGEITTDDAVLALKEYNSYTLMNVPYLSEAERAIADVSGNGTVDTMDAIAILRYYNFNVLMHVDTSWYELTGNVNAPGAPQ